MSRFGNRIHGLLRRGGRRAAAALARPGLERLEDRQLLASSLSFDFGPLGSPVAPGYQQGSVYMNYTPARGYGWTQAGTAYDFDRGGSDPLTRDLSNGRDGTFAVDLPNGTYQVATLVGDPAQAQEMGQIWAEGKLMASGLKTAAGASRWATFTTQVSDGQLNIRYVGGDSSWYYSLDALVITGATSANAGPGPSGREGSPVTFAGGAFGGTNATYSWDFGDGTTATGTLAPQHTYADNGVYAATLTVRDASGNLASNATSVTVSNVAPTPVVGGPYQGTIAMPISFSGSATDPGPADVAAGFTYLWDFGDGTTSTLQAPAHAYAAVGNYPVTLTVRDKDGATGTLATTATVSPYITSATVSTMAGAPGVPNFAQHPTIISARSGSWSDPGTWSLGRVPAAGDVVSVTGGTVVTYDASSNAHLNTVAVQPTGELTFRTDVNTRMVVGNFLVMPMGSLIVGTLGAPVAQGVNASIVIADQALDLTKDPEQYGTGLIDLGSVSMVGSAMNSTFVDLAAEPRAGDTTLTLAQPVSGWRAGDRVILPDTRQLQYNETYGSYSPQWEELTLAGISADGKTLRLSSPLRFDHLGARDGDGVLNFLPQVGDLTRNVTVSSENPDGTRGHTIFMGSGQVDLRYVDFKDLGRTTIQPLDSTTFDASGKVTHVGTNQIARYPVHMHHFTGPDPDCGCDCGMGSCDTAIVDPAALNGYQFTILGIAVDGGSVDRNFKWGIDIHHSSYGLIQDNVVYNTAGAGISSEDGSESYNVFDHNFVVRVHGTGDYYDTVGAAGDGYWFRGPNNYVRNNIAADTRGDGPTSYGFDFNARGLGVQPVPAYRGANVHMPGQSVLVDMNATPIPQFSGNQSYGASLGGLVLWSIGADGSRGKATGESLIKDFHTWGYYNDAVDLKVTDWVTIDGLVARGRFDYLALNDGNGPSGITSSDYIAKNLTIRNSDLQGLSVGFTPSTASGGGVQVIRDSYMRNYVDIAVQTLWSVNYRSDLIQPRRIEIRNVRFNTQGLPTVYGKPPTTIAMNYVPTGNANLIQKDEVMVYDYNGVPGDNFQLYYLQQAPTFVVPPSVYNADGTTQLTGAPTANLTNQQAMSLYGIAIAGAVAPSTAKQRAGIRGLVDPR